jgi:cell division protein FtsB
MDAMQILVIILASFLALFLLLAVILVVLLIKVTRQIKNVTTTAQSAANQINSLTANVAKVTSPALIAKMVLSQIKKVRK